MPRTAGVWQLPEGGPFEQFSGTQEQALADATSVPLQLLDNFSIINDHLAIMAGDRQVQMCCSRGESVWVYNIRKHT
jgi:hypothetical protein